jgi:hypothetical protein
VRTAMIYTHAIERMAIKAIIEEPQEGLEFG